MQEINTVNIENETTSSDQDLEVLTEENAALQPEEIQAEETQLSEDQPEEAQPEETQAEESQPEESQPEETQAEEDQAGEDQEEETQPEETQPEEVQAEEAQPKETQAEEDQAEEDQEEEDQEEETQAEETQPEEKTPESDEDMKEEKSEDEDKDKLPAIALPDPASGFLNEISVFCISQQGESHINNGTPCQDRSGFRWVNNILIAAIADGVGSCQLSDYGAETAIKASLDHMEQFLLEEMKQDGFVFDTQDRMKLCLSGAMQHALDSVEKRAEELGVLTYLLQSTLTIAAYDGVTLYFAHAGDDGIVAMNKEGTYAMVTARIKGWEASSVFPLQSKKWTYGKVNDTVAFVMATDGVLDAFVGPAVENNRVYYPFIEPVFYTEQFDEESAKANCKDWDEFLKSATYRNEVTDDITFVGVVNQKEIKHSVKPQFDDEAWNEQSAEYSKKRKAALYPPQNQDRQGSASSAADNKSKIEKSPSSDGQRKNDEKDSDQGSPSSDSSKRKSNHKRNIGMITHGGRKTLEGLGELAVGATATFLEVGGELLTAVGEVSEQSAEWMRRKRAQKNQQETETVERNENSTSGPVSKK